MTEDDRPAAVPREPSAWKLTDLIDVATLQSIQDTFARAFGLPTVIVAPDGSNKTEITHRLPFCEDFTRASDVGGPRCLDCDLRAMHEAQEEGKPAIFHCWNGLYDCAIPIAPKGQPLGYFLCGQVFTEQPDLDRYRRTALEIGADPEEYASAAQDVRIIPYEKYRASVESMHVLAEMIADQAAAAMDNFRMLEDALQARDDASRLMEELDTILEALTDIGSKPDHRSTLEAIADNLGRLIPYDSCLIYMADANSEKLTPLVVRDPYAEALREFFPRVGEGIIGKVAASRVGRMVRDASRDPDSAPVPNVPVEPEAMLVVPMTHKNRLWGVISLSRFERKMFTEHEFRVLSVMASTQAAMAIDNVRMYERERRMLRQYRLLADLGTELVAARDQREIKEILLQRTAEIFHTDVCFLATRLDAPDEVEITARSGRGSDKFHAELSRNARLAAIRLESEQRLERSVFEAWAGELSRQVSGPFGTDSFLAEPLSTANGVLGGIFVGWNTEAESDPHERRILSVIAGAGAATISNFATYAETDSSLRRRVKELQALTRLAERITGSLRVQPIVDELLSATIDLGRLEGAALAVPHGDSWAISQVSGMSPDRGRDLAQQLMSIDGAEPVTRWMTRANEHALAISLPGDGPAGATILGYRSEASSPDQDKLLATLARYGAIAMDKAMLHERQDQAIAGLRQANEEASEQYEKLQQLLSVHKSLTTEVLEGGGLDSLAGSLRQLTQAEIAIIGPGQKVLAASPSGTDIPVSFHSDNDARDTVTLEEDGRVTLIAPVVIEGKAVAWVAARTGRSPTEVDVTAVEYGALLTALGLLRERTAIEVETRLRGGLVDELFKGDFEEEMMLKQALALNLDLSVRSRVFVIDPGSSQATRTDLESIYAVISDIARRFPADALVALHGSGAAAICHESSEGTLQGEGVPFEQVVMEALKEKLPQLPVNVAVGIACERLSDYRRSYEAARRGLDLLRLLGRTGEVFSFREAGVEHLLLQTAEPEMVLDFIESFVAPLEAYDKGHRSNLRQSLETFYDEGLNLEATARRLHIHVSTLRYRLGKVEELLGVDVRGSDRLDVEFALRAAKILSDYRT